MSLRSWIRAAALDTRPLQVAPFRRLFVGQAAAVVGVGITFVTVPVQVFHITGSSMAVGLVGLAGFLPVVLFGLYGGALADAIDRRKLYLTSTATTWLCTLLLLVQALAGWNSVPFILSLVGVQAAGFALSATVRGAIIPALVDTPQLPAANALFYTAGTVGEVLGPLLAGVVLLAPAGYALAYGIDAILFTAALVAAFRLPPLPRPAHAAARLGLRSVIDGLRFLGARPVLLVSFLVDLIAMVFAMPEVLFPQAAAEQVNGGVGVLYASIAAGSVLIGLASGWLSKIRRQGLLLVGAGAAFALAVAAAGLMHDLWAMSAFLVVAGGADLISAVTRQSILQSSVPDGMRGRLQGIFTVVVAGGPRLGAIRAGAMAAATTLTIAWTGSALFAAAAILALIAIAPTIRACTPPQGEEIGETGSTAARVGDSGTQAASAI